MLANGGDGEDADLSDAADRVAFVTPLSGLLWAVAYDLDETGPWTPRPADPAAVGFEPSDPRTGVTVAVMRWHGSDSRERRAGAGLSTLDYGALFSRAWQPTEVSPVYGGGATLPMGMTADAVDGWGRLSGPWGRIEAEGAYLSGEVRQASLVPGVLYREPVPLVQSGGALESDFGGERMAAGLDLGYASGDPGQPLGAAPSGAPRLSTFHFHPEYRVDRILFRQIEGSFSDAVYLRPHLAADLARGARGNLSASLAVIGSRAVYGSSQPLGVEIDPTLRYESRGGIVAVLEHAVLFPLPGLNAGSSPLQSFRLRLQYRIP